MSETQQADKSSLLVMAWHRKSRWLYVLWPAAVVYKLVINIRRQLYELGFFGRYKASVAVIVVGNISVGGTGKTPLVIGLVKKLQSLGFKPAVISRGYGSHASQYPFFVTGNSSAIEAGDEPLLIARATQCPVIIGPKRSESITALLAKKSCDVVVSDDGLQHYGLDRDIEIAVVDSQRLFGNEKLLPMGPLREPVSRLETIDYIIYNGGQPSPHRHIPPVFDMSLRVQGLVNVKNARLLDVNEWIDKKRVHAVAGIGNPKRFFASLESFGFELIEHVFADHHAYTKEDLLFLDDLPVIMTEKDAVKISDWAHPNFWYLPVEAHIDEAFYQSVTEKLINSQLKY